MKDGSGNLDFGDKEPSSDSENDPDSGSDQPDGTGSGRPVDPGSERPGDASRTDEVASKESEAETQRVRSDGSRHENGTGSRSSGQSPGSHQTTADYPYFVRRSNVGDERQKRLECHVRPVVAQAETDFRNQLAAALGTDSVSKTDAREFALKFAFQHVDGVAEMMRDEGYDIVS